jgi:hypothetical protein
VSLRLVAGGAALLALLGKGSVARAEDACAAAYEESQVARSEGRLRAAQRELSSCIHAECPEFIRTDCARWLSEVEAALPSLVLTVNEHGVEVADVAVEFDGELLLSRIEGRAVPVDPGRHVLTFRREGEKPASLAVVIREGEKNRRIVAEFATQTPASAPPTSSPAPSQRRAEYGVWPHVLLGVGAAGVAGFATFGLLGVKAKHDLEQTCSPRCADGPIDAVHTKFVLADASLAVGVLALAASGYLFWSSSRAPKTAVLTGRLVAGLAITPQGSSGVARWSF